MQLIRYIQFVVFCVLILAASTSGFAQRQNAKAPPTGAGHAKVNVTEVSLEDASACGMVVGQDGMLYVLNSRGGRYDKGTLSKLNPEAFSRLQRGKDGRNHPLPEDFTELNLFGSPGEPSDSFNLDSIIAGADGKLYISGDWKYCARFDPTTQLVEWIRYAAKNPPNGDRNSDFRGNCFAASADGLLLCRTSREGYQGQVFRTRGDGKDMGGIVGTEQWNYATLANDDYLYGATADALIRVRTDGSDITVLHAFTGKNDHPIGALVLIRNTLCGYAHDEPKVSGESGHSGYIYKLNSDGTGYSTMLKMGYDPKGPLVPQGDFVYGMADPVTQDRIVTEGGRKRHDRSVTPGGLFRVAVDDATSTLIAPTNTAKIADAMVVHDGAAYVLTHSSQIEASIFRIPIPKTPASARQAPTGQTAGFSNTAPADSGAPVPGGKSVFHKRQSADDSQGAAAGAEATSAGSSSNAADEGMSARARPGLPPRQSKGQVSSSVAPASDAAPPPADEATSNTTPPASAPVLGGKSVFHKRQTTDDSEGTSAGNSSNAADEGMATQARPGLPPRQSKAPAKAPSTSADSESSFSSSKESLTPEQFAKLKAERRMANTGRKSERDDVASSGASSLAGGSVEDISDASGIAARVVQAFSDGDVETLGALYADTVDYYDSGRISSAAVRSQLEQYFSKWPVRQWEIASPVKVESLGGSTQRVVFSARYDVSNPDTNRHTAGTAKETLVIASDTSGAMKIISHHEKTSSSNRSDSTSSKRRQRQSEREKVYDGRPVIPLPPNIPWPPGIPHP